MAVSDKWHIPKYILEQNAPNFSEIDSLTWLQVTLELSINLVQFCIKECCDIFVETICLIGEVPLTIWHGNTFRVIGISWGKYISHRWIFFTNTHECTLLPFPLIYARTSCWTNSWVASDLRRPCDATAMEIHWIITASRERYPYLSILGNNRQHYNEAITGAIASQITSLTSVYSIVYLDTDQRKHQSSASLAFVRRIHRGPVNSPHKWPVTRKMFQFDDVIVSEIIAW